MHQHGLRLGYLCRSQIVRVCQDFANSLDKEGWIDALKIDFSKAFDAVPHDWLIIKIVALGVDSRIVIWVRKFLWSLAES